MGLPIEASMKESRAARLSDILTAVLRCGGNRTNSGSRSTICYDLLPPYFAQQKNGEKGTDFFVVVDI